MIADYIKIGEHYFQIEYNTLDMADMLQTNFHHVDVENGKNFKPDMKVSIEGGYGKSLNTYEVTAKEIDGRVSYQREDYLIEADTEYKSAKVYVHDDFALKHALMNLYSAFIVHYKWGLLIHSSCVTEENKAYLFSGYSGAGKSTAAKLSLPRELLSDEATIVKVTADEVAVFNSPFRSELETPGNDRNVPLAAIHLLYQAKDNERIPLKKSEALPQLTDKVFYWSYQPSETAKIIKLLSSLIKQVPAYQLYFKKNNTFWELISNDKVHS